MMARPRLVVIVGPTAVGKTEAAILLAERLQGEIISADSRLLYRGMDIGTAKPTPEQRRRVPHHLIDVAAPDEEWSLGRFRAAALDAIADVDRRGNLPFLVGGTGQYVRAIVQGWSPPGRAADASLRRRLQALAEAEAATALHARLAAVDPARAAQIDPRNIRRVVRALEIYELTGEPPSSQRQPQPPNLETLTLGLTLPRAELYRRVDERIDRMLADGWLDEVRTLLARGYGPELPAFSAIGYTELAAVVRGEAILDDAVAEVRRRTRVFVRRQANWFKPTDPTIRWFPSEVGVEGRLEAEIRRWLER